MDDRSLVKRLLDIGVVVHRQNPNADAMPADDPQLTGISAATIANWLEELGRHRLIGDVQPHLSRSGTGFRFQVTDRAARLWSNYAELEQWLNKVVPVAPRFDVFISYAAGYGAISGGVGSFGSNEAMGRATWPELSDRHNPYL